MNAIPPKRIYLQWDGDGPPHEATLSERQANVTWCADKIWPSDWAYVRVKNPRKKKGKKIPKGWEQLKNDTVRRGDKFTERDGNHDWSKCVGSVGVWPDHWSSLIFIRRIKKVRGK